MISNETLEILASKVVFLDFDGVLAEYRYNGHISAGDGSNNGQTVEEINNHVFRSARPIKSIIEKVEKYCKTEYLFVLGHVRSEGEGLVFGIEKLDKKEWLAKYCPFISSSYCIFLVEYESKAEHMDKICKRLGTQDAVLIDDKLDILREVEEKGYKALHVSSLID